jgi:hypothetical protein
MHKFISTIILSLTLVAPAVAQNVSATTVNYGNGAIVKESVDNGVPADSCTGLLRYTQKDATPGQNTWECINDHMIQQGLSGSGNYTPPTGTGFAHVTSGAQDSAARSISPSDIVADTAHNGGLVANRAVGGSDILSPNPDVDGVIYTVKNGVGVLLYPDGTTKAVEVGPQTFSCQVAGPGDGLNTITTGTYPLSGCFNEFGETLTITAIKCYTDAGTSTLAVTNNAGTSLLTGPITCSTTLTSGTLSGTTTLASGDLAKFSFAASGSVKQATFIITGTRP